LDPDVIVSSGTPGALAFQQITRTVPVVFTVVSEPVTQGIVQSLAHPGGNMTGFSYMEPSIGAKWVELLKEIAPHVTRVALVFNPDASPQSRFFYQSMETVAPKLAVQAVMAPVRVTRTSNKPWQQLRVSQAAAWSFRPMPSSTPTAN
jgi:putative ABC transport system substrate-binding protein